MSNIKPGLRLSDEHGAMRVMAVAEGYVMLRRPRATPFVRSVKEIEKLLAGRSNAASDTRTPAVGPDMDCYEPNRVF